MTGTAQMVPLLSERDVRSFLREAPKKSHAFGRMAGTLLLGLFLVLAIYIGLNFSSLIRLQSTPEARSLAKGTPSPEATAAPTPTPTPTPVMPTIPENSISISDLAIAAPIHWNTAFDEKVIQNDLESGVVHLEGTAQPGQTGMVVITGHSSNYPWDPGKFNSVFAPLHKAVVGQDIVVNSNNVEYTYKITRIYQVQPTDLSVLEATDSSGIRLITCTPIGFTLRRLIIEGAQVSPDPAKNAPFQQQHFTGSLPQAK